MLERDVQILMDATPEGRLDAGWQSGVMRQRAKTIKAGRHLYLDSYPIWDTRTERNAQEIARSIRQRSKETMDKLNARRAQRKLEVLINANFGPGDLLVTCTYRMGEGPDNAKQAARDATNMIARLKRIYARTGKELRYIYVTEVQRSRKGDRYHHHMILSAGPSREQVEECWTARRSRKETGRGLCNTRRAQSQPEGLTGWAKYITKSASGYGKGQETATKRKWCASKNLIMPQPSVADKKISRRRVEKIARDMTTDHQETRKVLEKLYPGYELLECRVRTSEWVTGAYISVIMAKKEEKRGKTIHGGRTDRGS
ncbi:MAG: hypothetical protein IJ418_00765 [Clostridia bacterium]|nr:hypothetical protein [Clostridia bacterium]